MNKQYFIQKNQRVTARAEEDLYSELVQKGYRVSQQVPVDFESEIPPRGTFIDLVLDDYDLPIYLDGPAHLKQRHEERDDKINFRLLDFGYRFPVRIDYNGRRPSGALLLEWVRRIEARLATRDSVKYWET